MELNEDQLASIYLIALCRPDHVYIIPESGKLYMLNADKSDLIAIAIPGMSEMTDEELNVALQEYLKK